MWWLCIFLTLIFHPLFLPKIPNQTSKTTILLFSKSPLKTPEERFSDFSAYVCSGLPWYRGKIIFCLYLQSKSSSILFFKVWNFQYKIAWLAACVYVVSSNWKEGTFDFCWVFCLFVLNLLTSQEMILLKQCIKLESAVNTTNQNREESCEIFLDE